ncbi:Phosphatidate phosphatase LPIN3 [Lemmus lemmus]
MNYVGQLAETVFGTVKELYRGLNPATLSGGIDVLVVKQPDGSFRCSPFHVRFGKLGVLRSREKVVDIEVNGGPVDLHMKLGDSGEAFFVQELDSDEEEVPPRLCTSPIPWGGLSGFPSDSQLGTASEPEGLVITGRKKRRRRRKPRRREDAVDSSSEELEAGAESELPSQEKPTAESPSAQEEEESSPQTKDIYPYSDGECTLQAGLSSGDLMSPKSDSELELRSLEPSPLRAESHMQWAWGRLPKVAKAERHELSMALDSMMEAVSALPGEPEPSPSSSAAGVDISRPPMLQPAAREDTMLPDVETHCEETLVGSPLAARETKETKTQNSRSAGHPPATKSWSWATLESHIPSGHPEVSKGKGSLKRNHHLGPSDIYLDDLSSLDSENAALYFPQSDCGMGPRRWSEPSNQKLLENPSPEHIAEPILDSVDKIALSLCGGLAETRDIPLEKFNQHVVSYEDLTKNPGLLDDPNLVVKINEKHYNWAVAAPMILCLQAFQKNLPKHSAQREKTAAREQQGEKMEVLSSDDDAPDSPVILEVPPLPPSTPGCIPTYKKSLRLSSEQIRYLNLHEGANDVVFSVTTQYQGTCRCKATIYLWNWDDKVVISDIDGTITKSDALGHILPQLGKDWTHQGITSLYHKIHLNGYKFLYCSARAIGMADLTKGYLQWVSERGCGLPKGPILLSPSSLFSALHREVIEKKPEVFKVACLSDIQQLFLPQGQPFYAAFGNRPNDVFAYRQVGLPESRIFTVNPRGDLVQELIKNHKSTYQRLGEVVELLFPPVVRGPSTDLVNPEYSNFCYWREPLPHVDFDALA